MPLSPLRRRWSGGRPRRAAVAFVGAAVVGGIVLGGLVPQALDEGTVWIPAIVAFATVPISVGIAVLRYRLYEIDRIISRTIGWAVVSSVLVAVFMLVILVTPDPPKPRPTGPSEGRNGHPDG